MSCILWKPLCPFLYANALTVASAPCASLRQPADQRSWSNTGGGDLWDWSQTFFHLCSADASTCSNVSFSARTGEAASTKRAIWVNPLNRAVVLDSASTHSSQMEIKIRFFICFYFLCTPIPSDGAQSKYVLVSEVSPRRKTKYWLNSHAQLNEIGPVWVHRGNLMQPSQLPTFKSGQFIYVLSDSRCICLKSAHHCGRSGIMRKRKRPWN